MKLLRVKASHFKNCQDDTVIDWSLSRRRRLKTRSMSFRKLLKACMCIALERLSEKMLPVKQLLWNCWNVAMIFLASLARE